MTAQEFYDKSKKGFIPLCILLLFSISGHALIERTEKKESCIEIKN